MDKYLDSFREMISLRGLTDHTLISYSTYISAYLQYLTDICSVTPEDASWQQMRDFIFWLQYTRGISDRTVNSCIAQLKFFTLYVLHKPWDPYQIPFRKFDSYIPFVPSREEMKIFLFSISDIKFKTILCIMFSTGMRVGEVRHLKCADIEHSSKRIHVRASKNRSDRYAQLSDKVWELILRYWYSFPAGSRPKDWLFPQKKNPDKPIDHQRIPDFIRAHEKELGWEHRFTCHTFRHAFATYLYEDGTDLLTLKALMGHRSISSTVVYVHLASKSLMDSSNPFDTMAGDFHE